MKKIIIMNSEKNSSFNCILKDMLELLNLDCSNLSLEEKNKDSFLDYVVLNYRQHFKECVPNGKWYFINMDDIGDSIAENNNINICGNIVTYGFGSKNTVTLSSVSDEKLGFVYCIQRYLKLNDTCVLEPQEIPVDMEFNNDTELYAVMIVITIALIEGKDCMYIKKMLSKKNELYFIE